MVRLYRDRREILVVTRIQSQLIQYIDHVPLRLCGDACPGVDLHSRKTNWKIIISHSRGVWRALREDLGTAGLLQQRRSRSWVVVCPGQTAVGQKASMMNFPTKKIFLWSELFPVRRSSSVAQTVTLRPNGLQLTLHRSTLWPLRAPKSPKIAHSSPYRPSSSRSCPSIFHLPR